MVKATEVLQVELREQARNEIEPEPEEHQDHSDLAQPATPQPLRAQGRHGLDGQHKGHQVREEHPHAGQVLAPRRDGEDETGRDQREHGKDTEPCGR